MKTFRILLGNWNMYIYTDKKKESSLHACIYFIRKMIFEQKQDKTYNGLCHHYIYIYIYFDCLNIRC